MGIIRKLRRAHERKHPRTLMSMEEWSLKVKGARARARLECILHGHTRIPAYNICARCGETLDNK